MSRVSEARRRRRAARGVATWLVCGVPGVPRATSAAERPLWAVVPAEHRPRGGDRD